MFIGDPYPYYNSTNCDLRTFTVLTATAYYLHKLSGYRWYGCGAVFPECVEGCTILDLGSGAGVDCFVLSKMVGPTGHVTGVDMTPEQV